MERKSGEWTGEEESGQEYRVKVLKVEVAKNKQRRTLGGREIRRMSRVKMSCYFEFFLGGMGVFRSKVFLAVELVENFHAYNCLAHDSWYLICGPQPKSHPCFKTIHCCIYSH